MPLTFDFLLQGPPVSVNAKEQGPASRRRYREWKQAVRAASAARWPVTRTALQSDTIQVRIVCYHTDAPPDVDNIVKPIFDGMNGVVYVDDKQVCELNSRRVSLKNDLLIDPPILVAEAIDKYSEIVYVRVFAPDEDEAGGEI